MNSLVDMYCSCGVFSEALYLFKLIPAIDVFSWSSIVSVFAEHGDIVASIKYLYEIYGGGRYLQSLLFPRKQIHGLLLKLGLNGSAYVRSSLIDMYGNSTDIESSLNMFDEIHGRNLCGFALEAIRAFEIMVLENIRTDEISLSKILKACASMASLNMMNSSIHNSPYFYQIQSPTTTSLTAFILACARNGFEKKSLKLFDLMLEKGLKPDSVTFLSLLYRCSHGGLIEEGKRLFKAIENTHGIIHDIHHY
ncbi:hypothetical protein AMTRI_Chr10g3190 [Amborella trichopoda]